MKKIIPLTVSMLLMLAVVIFAVAAYFNDIETSSGNTLTAGTLDLKVDGEDNPTTINVANMKPGDTVTKMWALTNVGSITGKLSIKFSSIINYENGQNEPEALVDPTAGDLEGELGANLVVTGVVAGYGNSTLSPATLNVRDGYTWFPMVAANMGENAQVVFTLTLSLPSDVGNIVQSDSVEFNITFQLDQAL